MRRILSLTTILVVALLLAIGFALAAQPASQQGLPPELTIATQPPLTEQLQALQGLATYAQQNGSKAAGGGGPFSGLKSVFGGGGSSTKVVPVTADSLNLNAAVLRGAVVSVTGIYRATGKENGKLDCDGSSIQISMPVGVRSEGFDQKGPNGLPTTVEGVVERAASGAVQVRATSVRPEGWLVLLRVARVQELLGQPDAAQKTYDAAFAKAQAVKSPFAAYATTSAARIAYDLRDVKTAKKHYAMAWNPFTGINKQGQPAYYTWVPAEDGTGWQKLSVREALKPPLETLNKNDIWYKVMDTFVMLAGGNRWLGIVFLSILSRVLIWPLTKKQLDSAESMKRLQPQIKALQDKYVDDKQLFQTEFWKLCQANGVNPLGGCLPMIAQMPILIMLWNGIRNYIVQFDGHGFLWVKNLASPDMGLLVAYTISMIFFQKMTQKLQPAPTMNPQQAQQQQMMTYMMPLMFFFFFQTFPAAFLLYWLATNMVYFAQQYTYTRRLALKNAQGTESLVPEAGKPAGLAGAMAKMMSLKGEPEQPTNDAVPSKSYHEQQAEDRGKKTAKSAEPPKRKK